MSNKYYWTKDEENFLKENYNKIPAKKLHKILHKSEQAIWSKASKLGLSKMIVPRTMPCKNECKELKAKLDKIKEIAETVENVCTHCELQINEYKCNSTCNAYKLLQILKIIKGAEDDD